MIISLILNIGLLLFGIIGCVRELKLHGIKIARYYTFLSNVIGTVAGLLMTVAIIMNMAAGQDIPVWIMQIKYMATACLGLTFIVVMTVLAPSMGKGGYKFQLTEGNLKFQHLICPLLAMLSFILADAPIELMHVTAILAWAPTLLYAIVTIFLNLINVLEGPYFFLEVHKNPWWQSILWFIGVVGFQMLIVMGLGWLNNNCAVLAAF